MIEAVLDNIDTQVSLITQTTFGSLAGEIGTLAAILGGVGFLILTLNMLVQLVPMHGGAIFAWAVKFLLVTAAASSWAFFEPIYQAIIGVGDGVAALLLGGGTGIASGLQQTVDVLWANYDTLIAQSGLSNVGAGFSAVLVAVVAIFLTCAGIMVIGISKMGLAIALGVAPLFIITLLFKTTSDLFGSWTKFTLSFVMVLILTAGIIGVLSQVLGMATGSADGAENLEDMIAVLVISVATIFFLMQVPSYASALAGSIASAGVSLSSAGGAMAGGAKSAASKTAGAAVGGYTASKVAGAAVAAGSAERAGGGSMFAAAQATAREGADIYNKSRASTNARLRGAAAESLAKTNKPPKPAK